MSETPTPAGRRRMWLLVAAGITVVVAIVAVGLFFALRPAPADARQNLINACREAVKTKMKAPATAQWPGGERVTTEQGSNTTVDGQVDAQNGFGALIRSPFRCRATHDGAIVDVSAG